MQARTFFALWLSLIAASFLARASIAADSATFPAALTIEALQRLGLEGNGVVRAARAQLRAAEAGIISAGAYPNPEIDLQGGRDRARLPGVTAGDSRSMFVTQRIENPVLRGARIGGAEAGVAVSRARLDQVRADLAAELRVRAYELLLRQEEARDTAGNLTLIEEVRRRVKVRVDTGEAPRYELIKADAEVLVARSRSEAAQLHAKRARVVLVQLVGGALPDQFEVRASLLDPVRLPPLEALRAEASQANPDLTRLEAEFNRARMRIGQERAAVLPSVQLKIGQQQDAEIRSNLLGLNVMIPFVDRRRGPIGEAVAESERVRASLDFRRFEIGQQLESAWQATQIAQRKVESFEGGVIKEAEAALRVAEAAYRFGERGLLEVLDAQRVLRGVRAELLQARFELQSDAAEIDRLRALYPMEKPGP